MALGGWAHGFGDYERRTTRNGYHKRDCGGRRQRSGQSLAVDLTDGATGA